MLSCRCLALAFFTFVLLHAGTESRHTLQERAIVSCETMLSNELCKTLRDLATNLKLTAGVIDDAVRDVVKKGITSVPEIVLGVRAYLKNLITNKVCVDLLSKDMCDRIHKVTDMLKIGRNVVRNIIHEVVVMGIPTPLKIYRKVMEKVRDLIKTKTCEDFLSPELCKKLRNIATGLKTDVKLVEDFVKDAILSGIQRREEIFQAVVDYLRERVLSLKCENLINEKICGFLKSLATNLKLKVEVVDNAVKEAILLGKTTTQSIIDYVRQFLKTQVLSLKCDDLIPSAICGFFKSLVTNLKLKVELVDKAVKDAILLGKTTTQSIIDYVRQFLKTQILSLKCDDLIPSFICSRLRSVAKRLKVRVELVDQFVKDAIANGKETITDITGFVTGMIKERIKCENWLGDTTCGLIRRIAKRLGVGVRDVEQKLRDIIASGKSVVSDIYREIINYIKSKIFG